MSSNNRQPALALANMNIERSRNLWRVKSFLTRHAPDIVCLQESMAADTVQIRHCLGHGYYAFEPMGRYPGEGQYGLAIFSRFPLETTEVIAYAGSGSGDDLFDLTSVDSRMRTVRYIVLQATVRVTIATTHFPWTPDGQANYYQRQATDSLLRSLNGRQLVLCGDFNAPRGREIFGRLASQWRDNVPVRYTTSIDPNLHRAGDLQLLVDGVFSTDDYWVTDVVLHEGISDHCVVTATVSQEPAALKGVSLKETVV
jgi:endonuclease/exonuclease/phosphatase family metal-dependent hydrolase